MKILTDVIDRILKFNFFFRYALPVILVTFFTYQPYFKHGLIDFGELSLYLPYINEVLHGKIIFKDLIPLRGPLEIYVPAILMSIFGKHVSVLYAWFYFGNVLAIIFVVLSARMILRSRIFTYFLIPILVADTFSLVYFKMWGGFRFAAGLISVWCALNFFKRKKTLWLFFAGFFSALGFFFSADMGVFSSLAIATTLVIFREKKNLFQLLVIFIFGAALVSLPLLLFFIITGGLKNYFDSIIVTSRSAYTIYHFELTNPDMPHNILQVFKLALQPFKPNIKFFAPLLLYITLVVYLIKKFLQKRLNSRLTLIFCLSLYGFLMYCGSFRQIWGPQFLIVAQISSVLFFMIAESWFIYFKEINKFQRPIFIYIIMAFLFFLTYFSIFEVKNNLVYGLDLKKLVFRQVSKGCFASGELFKRLNIPRAKDILLPDFQAEEIDSTVNYLIDKTKPDEVVFSFPDSIYNFLIDRPSLSRFCYFDIASYKADWAEDFFRELKNDKPNYIIFKRDKDWFEPLLAEFPLIKNRELVRNFVKDNYIKEVSFGRVDIYRLR